LADLVGGYAATGIASHYARFLLFRSLAAARYYATMSCLFEYISGITGVMADVAQVRNEIEV
jgi:hypothetical protein